MNFKKYIILLSTPKAFIKQVTLVIKLNYIRLMALILPDRMFLRCKYRLTFNRRLHLRNPKLFNEKLQWLKIYDRKPIYHQMVDKIDAKLFVAERVGNEYVIPTLGVYNNFKEIKFNQLPNQFIIKGSFDSGSYYICKDKALLNIKEAKKKVTQNWHHDYYLWNREWPYKGLKHRIIAEPLLQDGVNDYIADCKFFCFNGIPKIVYYSHDISKDAKTDFYDMEWNHLPIRMKDPNSGNLLPKPKHFEKMREIASVLSHNTFHLRVDFYLVNDRFYVGEMTFFHCGGFQEIWPEEYNAILGSWIKLPIDNL